MARAMSLSAAAAMLWLAGCECDATPACEPGTHGCPCDVGSTCVAGATCTGGICLDPSMDAGELRMDAGPAFIERDGGERRDARPNPDAFWAMDPPPMECLEDGTMRPVGDPPGGTPECPDDKNREGCPCTTPGETAACWPGLRVNRGRGICMDGVTTCQPFDEFMGAWGPCVGAVLPVEGAERGPQACRCFSAGRWELDNLSPCFITYNPGGVIHAVSTNPSDGTCPAPSGPPPTPPGPTWSANRLTVDCEGRFNLCYTLKAGNADAPSAADCTVARVCTGDFWYMTRDVPQELPPLASWVGADPTCAAQFANTGGYGEMSVVGLSVECDPIDDGSAGEYVFNRVNYCPLSCSMNPTAPECVNCMRGGSGMF